MLDLSTSLWSRLLLAIVNKNQLNVHLKRQIFNGTFERKRNSAPSKLHHVDVF